MSDDDNDEEEKVQELSEKARYNEAKVRRDNMPLDMWNSYNAFLVCNYL